VLAGPALPGRQPVRVEVIRDQVCAEPLRVHRVGPEPFGDLLQLDGQLRLGRARPDAVRTVRGTVVLLFVLILVRAGADCALRGPLFLRLCR
jgi:hypothetical protein